MIDHNDPRLTAFVLGELPETDVAEVEAAIDASPELAAIVDEIRSATGMLEEAYASEESPGRTARSSVAVAKRSMQQRSNRSSKWTGWLVAASFAGAFLAGVSHHRPNEMRNPSAEIAMDNDGGWTFYTIEEHAPKAFHGIDSDSRVPDVEFLSGGELPSLLASNNWPEPEVLDESVYEGQLTVVPGRDADGRFQTRFGYGGLVPAEIVVDENTVSEVLRPDEEIAVSQSSSGYLNGKSGITGGGRTTGMQIQGQENAAEVTTRDQLRLAFSDAEGRDGTVWLDGETRRHQAEEAPASQDEILKEAEIELQQTQSNFGSDHPAFMQKKKQLELLKKQLAKEQGVSEKSAKPKSWKRVKAIPNTTRLMIGDKEELSLGGMQVNAQIDGFRARVLVDYFYYNDRDRQLEGNFKLRLPDDASLYYFAFGESVYDFSPEGKLAEQEFLGDGSQFVSLAVDDVKRARKGQWDNVKEARMVPREKAAHAFRETVRQRVDPALVEWSGAGVFSARVFPLAPKKLHRIVVGYDVNLKRSDNGMGFELDLPEQTGQCRVELNVQEIEGAVYTVTPAVDPIAAEINGKLQKRFVFEDGEEGLSKVRLSVDGIGSMLLQSSDDEGEFWTAQVTPDLPATENESSSRAIFLVDTSLSSSPDKFNVWLRLLESTLNNNRDSLKEFDVLFFNVGSHFWKGQFVANTEDNVAALKQTMESLALEGATDLYGAIEKVKQAKWIQDGKVRPDLFLLSDGAATWGETDLRMIEQLVQSRDAGSLFAYQTGLSGTSISSLRFLAGSSGGAVFSVASEQEIEVASTAHRKRPWQLKSIEATGASDILTAGRVQWVYPGQSIGVVGRGTAKGDLKFQFQQADRLVSLDVSPVAIESELASRAYGQVSVGQLEALGSQVFDISAAYARHFRITGQTCSLLMLESEEDYQRFDIKPQEDLFVVKAKPAAAIVAEAIEKYARQLADPKAKLIAWLKRLESMPGMQFKIPTALQLAIDDIKVEPVSSSLDSTLARKSDLSESYLKAIADNDLDYDAVSAEAVRRSAKSVDDAIKVYSSLVERDPGSAVVARDIAFTAMEMDRPAQAFHLLNRVAKARPFQGSIYPAIGQCLTQLGKADMAIVYYEIAISGTFSRQGAEFRQIVAAQYIHLLRQIVHGKLESSVKDFAAARLETLGKHLPFKTADVIVTMMWNQDQTDVDLHVVEPSGEECFYEHRVTRSGGRMTSDITTGFGPEMYYNSNAPTGKYQLKAKYFSNSQNRTSTRNKVYLTIIRGFGTDKESTTRRSIKLSKVGQVEPLMTLGLD